jgi:hypothetical protein
LNEVIHCFAVLIATRFDHAVVILGLLRRQREIHCASTVCQDCIFLNTRCNASMSYDALVDRRLNALFVRLAVYRDVNFMSLHTATCQDAGMECFELFASVRSGSKGQASDLPAYKTPDPCIYCDVKYLAGTPRKRLVSTSKVCRVG